MRHELKAKAGDEWIFVGFKEATESSLERRLQDFGFFPRLEIRILSVGLLGSPVWIETADGTRLALRADEASCLMVDRVV